MLQNHINDQSNFIDIKGDENAKTILINIDRSGGTACRLVERAGAPAGSEGPAVSGQGRSETHIFIPRNRREHSVPSLRSDEMEQEHQVASRHRDARCQPAGRRSVPARGRRIGQICRRTRICCSSDHRIQTTIHSRWFLLRGRLHLQDSVPAVVAGAVLEPAEADAVRRHRQRRKTSSAPKWTSFM